MKKSTRLTYLWQRILMGVVFVVGALGVILNKDISVKSEYLFICAQSALFLIVSFLPNFLIKFKLDIPDFIYIIFIFFCLAHFFCGEILGFFVKIKWWDSALHTFSGMLIALLSFSLINLLNKNTEGFKLNIWFAALFAFSLTVTTGVIWEIIEYASDSFFGTNMQRAYVSTMNGRGEALLGQSALNDTMKDLMLDSIGAVVVCVVCIIAVCKKKINVEDLSFIRKKKNTDEVISGETLNLEQKEISQKDDDVKKNTNTKIKSLNKSKTKSKNQKNKTETKTKLHKSKM